MLKAALGCVKVGVAWQLGGPLSIHPMPPACPPPHRRGTPVALTAVLTATGLSMRKDTKTQRHFRHWPQEEQEVSGGAASGRGHIVQESPR